MITEEEFRVICDKIYKENGEQAKKSVYYYGYLMAPIWLNRKDGVESFDFDSPLFLENYAKAKDYVRQNYVPDKTRKVQSNVEGLKEMEFSNLKEEDKGQKSADEPYADLDSDPDPDMRQLKLECEILDKDQVDLSRISTIDIKDTFSFKRIHGFSASLSSLAYTLPRYNTEKLQIRIGRFRSLVKYNTLLNDKFNQLLGYKSAEAKVDIEAHWKEHQAYRTSKSTESKRMNRRIKERYVCEAYRQLTKKNDKEIIEDLSETKMAGSIRDLILDDLKTQNIKSISQKTIIDILRKRDKKKLPFYPWGKQ